MKIYWIQFQLTNLIKTKDFNFFFAKDPSTTATVIDNIDIN